MDQYVDAVIGNDANAGTAIAPKATYAAARAATGSNGAHRIFLRAGQRHALSGEGSARSGLSASARFQVLRYGDGPNPVLFPTWAPGSSTHLWWQLAGSQFITVEDVVFDAMNVANFGNVVSTIINSAADINDIIYRRCAATGGMVGWSAFHQSGLSFAANAIRGLRYEYCSGDDCGRHGFYKGGIDTLHLWCNARRNGWKDGGHGFSSQGQNVTSVTTGWTLVSGTIYSRPTTPDALGVWTNHATNTVLVKNTTTPTVPAVGEFGVSGGFTYANAGVDMNTLTSKLAQIPQQNTYIGCFAGETYAFTPYPFMEGSGFQSDDYTIGNSYIGCVSDSNAGAGLTLNNSANVTVRNFVAKRNGIRAAGVQKTAGVSVLGFVGVGNNRGGLRYPPSANVPIVPDAYEMFLQTSPGVTLQGLAVAGKVGQAGAINIIDARSAQGSSVSDVRVSGSSAVFMGTGVTNSNASTVADLMVTPDGRPLPGSPLLTDGPSTYRRDKDGRQARRFIGALGAATLRRALTGA